MSQQDVLDWMRKHRGPHTVHEIAAGLGCEPQVAQKYIARLRRWGDVMIAGEDVYHGSHRGRYLYMLREDLKSGPGGYRLESVPIPSPEDEDRWRSRVSREPRSLCSPRRAGRC